MTQVTDKVLKRQTSLWSVEGIEVIIGGMMMLFWALLFRC